MNLHELDFLGDKVVMRLYHEDIKTVDDLLAQEYGDLMAIDGFGAKKLYKIMDLKVKEVNQGSKVVMGE